MLWGGRVLKKRINKPQHIRQVLSDQINELMAIEPESGKDRIAKAKAIAYVSSISLTSMRDVELEIIRKEIETLREDMALHK